MFFAGFGRAGCFGGFGRDVLRHLVLLSVFGGACTLPDCKQVSAPDLVGLVLQIRRHKTPRRRRDNNCPIRGFGIRLGFGQRFLRKHRRSFLHNARKATPISRDGREAPTSPTAGYSTTMANSSAGIPKHRAAK